MNLFLHTYHIPLVSIAIFIAILASFTFFILADKAKIIAGIQKKLFQLASAASLIIGIWAMHTIALSTVYGANSFYEHPIFYLSNVSLTIGLVYVALLIIQKKNSVVRLIFSSLFLSLANYICFRINDIVTLQTTEWISFLFCFILTFIAFYTYIHVSRQTYLTQSICAVLLGISIISVHFIHIGQYTFLTLHEGLNQFTFGTTLGIATIIILGLTLLFVFINDKLIENAAHYQSLFEHNSDIVLLLGLDGTIISGNRRVKEILGYSPSEYSNQPFYKIVHEIDMPLVLDAFHKSKLGEYVEYEIQLQRKDKQFIYLQVKNIPMIIGNEIKGVYSISKDITNRKKDELMLKQSEAHHRLLVENSQDTIAITDGVSWLYVNPAGIRLFQAETEDEILGRAIYDFLHANYHEQCKQRVQRILKGSIGETVEQEWHTLKGDIVETEVTGIPTLFHGEKAVQVIIRDISDRKKAEQLMVQTEKLSMAGQLAAGIAHEIRNPLTAIKGFVQLMKPLERQHERYYDIIITEMNRIELIVNELLILSKPHEPFLNEQNMNQLLYEVLTLLETQAIMLNIILESDLPKEPLHFYGDGNQLKQVFINIIKNAIEVMPNGGKISIVATEKEKYIVVDVTDEGCGIPSDEMKNIGTPFYTTKENGTGLGLATTYKIIDAHQGKITVQSEVNVGSTFTIYLPLIKPKM
ncbi:PAS domain S-box protein [Alkalihalobacillus sp. LMS39]|uniref:PAS domain S-box protein n=1 Tax=Alkalihalobacillus sp. LMS39 TaxID=2924032 RepID=UPI001FB46628|nr:PAS domain S-box protein [Alkalihalobacillus sp. LMS39]UOE92493.1 PAS domain S-box protein [Alkalihalobacillus sp. LMS39]